MRTIRIFDTTLRDGEQVPGAKLNTDQKLEIAKQLARLNVDIIEAGFPISSPGDMEAVQTIGKEVEGPAICGLARAIIKDVDAAWEGVQFAAKPRIHTFISSSDIHIERQFNKDRGQVLKMAIAAVERAKSFTDDVEFSPMDATRSEFDFLCEMIEKTIAAGATTINVPDTVGYAIPEDFGQWIGRVIEAVPNSDQAVFSIHCHNDLGLASSNSLAAVCHGAGQIECTINGIGERAGNASMEEAVMAIRTRSDLFDADTNINTQEIARASRMVSTLMGIPVQPNKAIVGSNAFAHSSGIHQDGILKDRMTYEIIRPEDVGIMKHELVLTARSGRHALRHQLEEMGYQVGDDRFEEIYDRFLEVADKKKEVTEDDLEVIVSDRMGEADEVYHLEGMEALSSTSREPDAKVTVRRGDQRLEGSSSGDGPVDAVFRAIDSATGVPMNVTDFSVRAVTKGREALGEVSVRAERKGHAVTGRASATDIIEASARAYLVALNKMVALGE